MRSIIAADGVKIGNVFHWPWANGVPGSMQCRRTVPAPYPDPAFHSTPHPACGPWRANRHDNHDPSEQQEYLRNDPA